jgi:hypothetical protein
MNITSDQVTSYFFEMIEELGVGAYYDSTVEFMTWLEQTSIYYGKLALLIGIILLIFIGGFMLVFS